MQEERTEGSLSEEELSEGGFPEYKHEYDDSYKLLAYHLITTNDIATIRRMMKDGKFVRRSIVREVRGQDFNGPFIDCLFVAISENDERMQLMRQLDSLGAFLYHKLSLPRLRREIRKACEDLGLSDLLES